MKCPLCAYEAVRTDFGFRDVYRFDECHCGTFYVERCNHGDFLENERTFPPEKRLRLSALIRENEIRGGPPWYIQFGPGRYPVAEPNAVSVLVDEVLRSRWPRTVAERLDRTLCSLAHLSNEAGKHLARLRANPAVAFAKTPDEADAHESFLEKDGYIRTHAYIEAAADQFITVTAEGWRRFEELTTATGTPSNPAFVAMWYGGDEMSDEMTGIFNKAIHPAIVQAGYRGERADTEEHNDFIMDRVFGSIRVAPFVVADFTGNRNGVYIEAGYARGLGIPVIHTCRQNHFGDAHFDIKQINTIQWETAEDFNERLFHRIIRTVGPGPFMAELGTGSH